METVDHKFESFRRNPVTVTCLAASLVLASCSNVELNPSPEQIDVVSQDINFNETLIEFPEHRITPKTIEPTSIAVLAVASEVKSETLAPSAPKKSQSMPAPSARPSPSPKYSRITRPVAPARPASIARPIASTAPAAPARAEASRSSDGPENYKTFSAQEFVKLWWDIQPRPNTRWLPQPPSIYGNGNIDRHIRKVAEGRGYRQNPVNTRGAFEISNQFEAMRSAAASNGVRFKFTSGYRSPDRQRQIFTSKFNAQCQARYNRNCREAEITSGKVNDLLHRVLKLSSIPGYSSHHTGWVVDIGDNNGPFIKQNSAAFKWLSENNYWRAKKYGFGPRYPIGATSQGPDPEVWEFYYAGRDRFKK